MVRIIRQSRSTQEAKSALMKRFALTGVQAQAILDMRLARLTALEVTRLEAELAQVQALIAKYKAILRSKARLMQVIKAELTDIRKRHADARRTKLLSADSVRTYSDEDFIVVEDTMLVATHEGFIKRIALNAYNRSNRAALPDGLHAQDYLLCALPATTAQKAYFFTNAGYMYTLNVADIADARWRDKGVHISALINGYDKNERLVAVTVLDKLPDNEFFVFLTAQGMVKKTRAADYEARTRRLLACGLKPEDHVIAVHQCRRSGDALLLVTRAGFGLGMRAAQVEPTGRATKGVKAITLGAEDELIAAILNPGNMEILLLSDKGYAKRLLGLEISIQQRGGKGSRLFGFAKNAANGTALCAALPLTEPADIQVQQKSGVQTLFASDSIRIEAAAGGGMPAVLIVMDDQIERVSAMIS